MANNPIPQAALTAAAMIESFGFRIDLAESVVLVYDEGVVPKRASGRRLRQPKHPFRHVGPLSDGVDIVVATGPGAPVAAITVEFLAALGVRNMIAVGSAGDLHPSDDGANPVRTVIVDRAESDEGTSAHYGTGRAPNAELQRRLQQQLGADALAVALSTDAPFRHTSERLTLHRQRADVVEMECAALFAAANALNVAAAALLVTSDRFDPGGWRPNDPAAVRAELRRAVEVVAAMLTNPR